MPKEHKPTDELRRTVRAMTAYGVKREDIAAMIGVTRPTLAKHYEQELATGAVEANAKVAQSLYQQATNGNTTAAIFWAKTRMGWSEKSVLAQEQPFKMVIEWAEQSESESDTSPDDNL